MDKVLKQRLVGAAILIALAVIFVPMLFDGGTDRDSIRDSAIDLPPPPAERREVRRLPLDPDRAREMPAPAAPEPIAPEPALPEAGDREISLVEPGPEPETAPVEPATEEEPEPPVVARAEPQPETVTEPEPVPAPPEPAPEPVTPVAAEATGSWVVQVASFSSAETADRVMGQLGRLGHEAGVDVLVRGDSRLHRVRTGPYRSEAEAERARGQIAATVSGVQPVVREAPGVPAAPVAAAGGFAVQVGSFATRANADRLLEQLGGQGFEAFIHPDESGSRAIWRVRVGTVSTREEAARLQRQVLEEAGLEGLIVSHP